MINRKTFFSASVLFFWDLMPYGQGNMRKRIRKKSTGCGGSVILGIRSGRDQIDSPVPVYVIQLKSLRGTATIYDRAVLMPLHRRLLQHSYEFRWNRPFGSCSLRGLGPDQVWFLVNGKRRLPQRSECKGGTRAEEER